MAFLFSITITRSTVLRVTPYLLTSLKLYSNTLGTVAASKVQLKIKRLPSVLAVTLGLNGIQAIFLAKQASCSAVPTPPPSVWAKIPA